MLLTRLAARRGQVNYEGVLDMLSKRKAAEEEAAQVCLVTPTAPCFRILTPRLPLYPSSSCVLRLLLGFTSLVVCVSVYVCVVWTCFVATPCGTRPVQSEFGKAVEVSDVSATNRNNNNLPGSMKRLYEQAGTNREKGERIYP